MKFDSRIFFIARSNFDTVSIIKKMLFSIVVGSSLVLIGCKDDAASNKEDSARFTRSATTYQEQGQYRAAMLEAKNAIQNDPENTQAYRVLAKIYNQVGAYAATQKLLETIVKKDSGVSAELAEAFVETKKYRSALNVLAGYDAVKISPDAQLHKQVLIARSCIYLGDKTGYESALTQLKAIAGQEDEILFVEAEYLTTQGRAEDAQKKLEALSEPGANKIKSLILLGRFAMAANQIAKAEDFFSKALGLLPNTDIFTVEKTVVLGQLTEALIQQGKTSEAYRYQKLLADANPESQGAQQKVNDAMEYYRQGKFAEAQKVLDEVHEQFPRDKNTAMLLGLVQYQQGQDEEAIELFDKFIDPETATPTIIQAAVMAKYRSNKMDEAVVLLKKAVDSQPQNATILATYGLALLDRDPTSSEGERALEKSLAVNPKQQRLRLALAKRHIAMKNTPLAIAQLKKAYDETPLDLIIQQTYFKALFADGKSEDVKAEITKYQKNYPESARGSFLDGWYQLTQKNYNGAQLAFEKALSTKGNEERVLSFTGLAEMYQLQKQPQKAINVWQSLLEEDPTQVAAYSQWLRLVQVLNRGKEASTFLKELEGKTDKWQPSVVLAQLLYSQTLIAESIKHIEMALERSGNAEPIKQIAANLYRSYGLALQKDNKTAEAKVYLLNAIKFFPSNMDYLASLIELEIAQKNIPEAQKLLDQFSATPDVAAEHAYLQGVIRNAEGKQDAAMVLYLESWRSRPIDIVAEAIFAQYQQTNQKDLAAVFVEDWVKKLPKSPRPTLFKAIEAQEKNDLVAAVKWYEKTIELAPQLSAALNNLAWIYYEQKNPKAIDLAKRAYDLSVNNPPIMDTYGWILVENNHLEEGIQILERAVNLAPKNKEILDHLKAAKAKNK
jgi:cellulose synthase operon protein C